MKLIVLLLTALWYDSPSFGHLQTNNQKEPRVETQRWNKLSKRQDDSLGYLEQCSILQFWDKQIGRVNVLAFFDSSWQFSHRQASMLRILRERFDKTGFDNIQFFAINAASGASRYVDRSEVEVEEQTWKQISPSEADGVPPVVVSPEALIEALGPDVYFIQDTEELQIWPKLRAFRDQILVIDRCGRLTYQVIVPWSILHFPYVKAAILSTYKDEPCGHCQFQESPFDATTTEQTKSSGTPGTTTAALEETTTTLIDQIENNDNSSASEEILTFIIRPGNRNESTDSEKTTPLPVETESYTPTFYTTTTTYDSRSSDSYNDFLNLTDNENKDEYANYTTPIDLESTKSDEEKFLIQVTDKIDVDSTSEQQVSGTDIPTTTEISDSSTESAEARLKDSDEIESLESRDALKSRSTNARSVSPNDGSHNRLEVVEINGDTSGDEESLESDFLIPIRIIMRAPHVDEYSDNTMKAHEYLVLKTGLPDYHGHLDDSKEYASTEENEKEGHQPVRKKAEVIRRTFGKDENPGLYGEVVYLGNEQLIGNTQSSASDQDDDSGDDQSASEPHESNFYEDQVTPTTNSLSSSYEKDNVEDPYENPGTVHMGNTEKAYPDNSDFDEEVDVVEEEAKSKLIAHYSKLLPWLYYVLAK